MSAPTIRSILSDNRQLTGMYAMFQSQPMVSMGENGEKPYLAALIAEYERVLASGIAVSDPSLAAQLHTEFLALSQPMPQGSSVLALAENLASFPERG